MDLDPALVTATRRLLAEGKDLETLLRFLRDGGCGKLASIKILRDLGICSLRDAKGIVHYSAAWADVRQADEEWEDRMVEALREIARDDPRLSLHESDGEVSLRVDLR